MLVRVWNQTPSTNKSGLLNRVLGIGGCEQNRRDWVVALRTALLASPLQAPEARGANGAESGSPAVKPSCVVGDAHVIALAGTEAAGLIKK